MQFHRVIVGQIVDPEQFSSQALEFSVEHAWRSDLKYQL